MHQKGGQPASRCILLSRPTDEFSGIYFALKGNDLLTTSTAAVTILAKFLPILLSNSAYSLQLTYDSYIICSRMSMAILSLMVLFLLATLVFVRWPRLPVDPRTIAGMLYYVADSTLPDEFAGSSDLGERERSSSRLVGLHTKTEETDDARCYSYGMITGVISGRHKMGIYSEEVEGPVSVVHLPRGTVEENSGEHNGDSFERESKLDNGSATRMDTDRGRALTL